MAVILFLSCRKRQLVDNPQSQANLQQASLKQTGLGYQVYFTVDPELTGRYGIRQIGFFSFLHERTSWNPMGCAVSLVAHRWGELWRAQVVWLTWPCVATPLSFPPPLLVMPFNERRFKTKLHASLNVYVFCPEVGFIMKSHKTQHYF